ncbi:hypothetical protein JW848_03360 [Candidatus Bipolaricaulota bacterium]|nr:hypothetical protein [Candidatus Bipolaricaulota bacterium]
MTRATSLRSLVRVLGWMLIGGIAVGGPVEWAVGDAFDLRIEQVIERVQLGFMFGGFCFGEAAYESGSGLEISACLQEFSPRQGLAAIERGWPIVRMILKSDATLSGIGVPAGCYLGIAWISDCMFPLEGRWFEPRTPVILLVSESVLNAPLRDGAHPWYVLIPSGVVPIWAAGEHPAPIRCGPVSSPHVCSGAILEFDIWNTVRFCVAAALPDVEAPLAIPAAAEFFPGGGDIPLHEALFFP